MSTEDVPAINDFQVPENNFRDEVLKFDGWGYKDSFFVVSQKKDIFMSSSKYKELDKKIIPNLRPWIEKNLGVDFEYKTFPVKFDDLKPAKSKIADPNFLQLLQSNGISFTTSLKCRWHRSHGQSLHDIYDIWTGQLKRIPDIVVWPKSESDVKKIVDGAVAFDVVLIPIGGGTSVSNALNCPANENRCICSVDMGLMNKILWIDSSNFLCRAEAGILGQELERQLNDRGFTCGHEPDSVEFSQLGGWISTRASGMKKNKYGNIEDLLVHVTMVTPSGILRRNCQVPRISNGPDIHHIILGSEGNFGIITEATIKVFPAPAVKKFGSIVFPDFEKGIEFFREVAAQRVQPASLRLVDNEQFIMGQAMRLQSESLWQDAIHKIGRIYITRWKGFDPEKMVAVTCVFEGTEEEVEQQSKRIFSLASNFHGFAAGEENGQHGYRLTFAIAYLRDLGMQYSLIGESFETSVPWSKVSALCKNVKILIVKGAQKFGIKYVLATSRVTQVYDTGACVYFYFAFNYRGIQNPVDIYDAIETSARDEIIRCGGSISHHHGVGKIRKRWMPTTITPVGITVLRSIKEQIDPKNIFASNNTIDFNISKI